MSKRIEFGIDEVAGSGRVFVKGRCFEGPISRGDVFEVAFRYSPAKTLEDYGRPSERVEERRVSLLVLSIKTYHREIDGIGRGMTAQLELLDDEGTSLASGEVLGGFSALEDAGDGDGSQVTGDRPDEVKGIL
jgi:hypothetical protein